MRNEPGGKRNTYFTYQISHFHNSTFLNKLSRLSHQTILPRPIWLFFICVLIRLCRGPQLRECPVVSRRAAGCVSTGVKWVYVDHTGLSPLLKGKNQSSTRWQQGALQQRQMGKSLCNHTLLILASEITLVQR